MNCDIIIRILTIVNFLAFCIALAFLFACALYKKDGIELGGYCTIALVTSVVTAVYFIGVMSVEAYKERKKYVPLQV